jgi:sugar phosphate isomerase/epimerase
MDIGISTCCFGMTPLTLTLLERLRRAGFREIELHAALPSLNYQSRSVVRDVVRWFHENEMPSPSLHLPFEKDVLATSHFERQAALDELKRCLELNDLLPLRYCVLHLGEPDRKFDPVTFEYTYAAIATIQTFSGVRVFIETLDNEVATFSHIEEFRNAAQLPQVGICYDTGHGELEGPCDAIHLKQDGEREWPAFVERLLQTSFSGPMTIECEDDNFGKAVDFRSRLQDLTDEALNSIEEFRLKYRLPLPQTEEDE